MNGNAMHFNGVTIIQNPLAIEHVRLFKVVPSPIKKRRRGYRVLNASYDRPCTYSLGGTVVMHPELYVGLKEVLETVPEGQLCVA